MALFTVEADEVAVPVAASSKTVVHDPALVALLNDTLKPRGIPTPDGKAVAISVDTKGEVATIVASLRKLRDEDTGDVKYSPRAKATPKDKDNPEGPQSVVLWLSEPIVRQRKPKDEAPAEPTGDDAVIGGVTDETMGAGSLPNPDPTDAETVFQEPQVEESHGRKRWGH